MNKPSKKHKSSKLARLSVFLYKNVGMSALLWGILFLFGIFSYTTFMQREGFPQIDLPVSVVRGVYLADNKNQVDSQLTQPILQQITKLEQVKSTTATSTDTGMAIVVNYTDDVSAEDGSHAVEQKINSIKSSLPPSAQLNFQSVDAKRFNNQYDILLSVSSMGADTKELLESAQSAAKQIAERAPEATKVEAISPFEEAKNPITGEQTTRQVSFDRFGKKNGDEIKVNKSVAIGITINKDEDVIAFDSKLHDIIGELNNSDDFTNVDINMAAGFAPSIRQQLSSLQSNLVAGLAIVVAVCMIFIGLRAGLLAAAGLMITMSTSIGILYLMGISLNTVSLFALVLCLGLIVDDTVIIVEALDAQKTKQKSLKLAIASSVDKVALASAAGTFTTILGFAPLLFVSGVLGEFIRLLPITIIVLLFVSLVVALLFIPFFSRFLFSRSSNKKPRGSLFSLARNFETWLGSFLSGFITSANTKKKKFRVSAIAISISLIFILPSVPLFKKLKFDIFPSSRDSNAVQVELSFAPETDLATAQNLTDSANQQIKSIVGNHLQKISYLGNANSRLAAANITLSPYQERDVTAASIASDLQTNLKVKDARVVASQIDVGPRKEQFPFKVQIAADDPEQANEVAQKLVSFLKNKEITRSGKTTYINEVQYVGEKVAITRVNNKRIVEVAANFDANDTSALTQSAKQLVEDKFMSNPDNLAGLNKDAMSFDFGFESENQESFKSVIIALPLLVLAMFVLLAVQFKSLLQPLLILIAVPFSFFGVALALLLTDNSLSFFVMVAFFALIGISVNNSILLTDYANQARREGLSPRHAVAQAIQQRTRPLLVTSITSILALLPLALSDPFWESLAVTLIGGLTASTLLVLISFPYYYLVFEALRSRIGKKVY